MFCLPLKCDQKEEEICYDEEEEVFHELQANIEWVLEVIFLAVIGN